MRGVSKYFPARLRPVVLACALTSALVLLQACSTPRPPRAAATPATPAPATSGTAATAAPTEFILSGRVAAQYEDYDDNRKGELYGRFDWVEEGGSIELTLIDPLGQALARIVSVTTPAPRTTVTLRNGETYSDRSPEALTRRTLGWSLPLSGMQHWLRGRAGPDAEVRRDDQGRVVRIREAGWTISYEHGEVPVASPGATPSATPATPPATPPAAPHAAATAPAVPGSIERINLVYYGPGPQISLRLALDP